MRRLRWLALGLLALGACKGLLVDEGNDFPCDFTQPPEVRDAACAPGETCGVNGRCQRFVYEGPQFEGVPTFPDLSVGGRVHPMLLEEPVGNVALDPVLRHAWLTTTQADGTQRLWRVDAEQQSEVSGGDALPDAGALEQLAVVADGGLLAVYSLGMGERAFLADGGCVGQGGLCVGNPRFFRVGQGVAALLRSGVPSAGQVDDETGTFTPMRIPFQAELDGTADGGLNPLGAQVFDLSWVSPQDVLPVDAGVFEPVPVAVNREGFFARVRHDPVDEADSGWVNLLGANEDAPPTPGSPPTALLRRDAAANVWAVGLDYFTPDRNLLSTWLVGRVPGGGVAFSRAWSDCQPCPRLSQGDGSQVTGTIVGVAPKHVGVPTVEVLCDYAGTLQLVEVLGSTAAEVSQTCETQPLELPFEGARVARVDGAGPVRALVQDLSSSGQVALGGSRGEVWSGPFFSTALPYFLERVPTATGVLPTEDGGRVPLALTDRYLAARLSNNGFKTFRETDTSGEQIEPRAAVEGAPGWFVDALGRVLRLTPNPSGPPLLGYGPTLLDAHGQPARAPYFGEAVSRPDGTLVSFVMAADDSLYLVPAPAASPDPSASSGVLPELAPEPNVPIRSFTLERTPIGTDGVTKVRGYLVTSRNVYEYELSGTPPRWSTTALPLSFGEPVEVWMDNPRGGLGRVGYRDGTVLTLPGGFLLVSPSTPLKVLDYENYGGWPVAYTSTGLYVARWDYDDAANTLKNKTDAGVPSLPMTWRRLTLPDGGEPWLTAEADGGVTARPALLQVTSRTEYDGGVAPGMAPGVGQDSTQTFELLLYLDDAVYEVGQMARKNVHQVTAN